MEPKDFKPYIPADKVMPEMTAFSVIAGVLLSVLFGAANAYLGLRVGLTISASIPAAVISMGVLRMVFKRNSILETNMVQTIGSAGESLAGGAIFTIPVLFMWAAEGYTVAPSMLTIGLIALCGGAMGVFMMLPLRKALIVKEHGTLNYPEGRACSEVLIAGEEGGAKAGLVFAGLGVSAIYKFIADGLKLFPSEINWDIRAFKGAAFGMDVLPALGGVGYICGAKVSAYMFSGGVLSWFVLLPLIALFGSDAVIFPASVSVAEVFATSGPTGLWSNYIRYIGAGALAAGGILSLIKALPMMAKTFASAFKEYGKGGAGALRTEQELPIPVSLIGAAAVAAFIWLYPGIPVGLAGTAIILVFGFIFATISARMVGIIGSSNNPISGMCIATLLLSSLLWKHTGNSGPAGMVTVIAIGAVICIIAAMAGDMSQDLKTGFLVGATPKKQQIGELIGAVAAALAIGAILYLLNDAWGFGAREIPAPQATMMKMVVEGVMGGNLPWALIIIGVFCALVLEVLGLPVLAVAIGIYLPIHSSAAIMVGGLVRLLVEKRKYKAEGDRTKAEDCGLLYCSGMIAGEGVVGILLAVLAVVRIGGRSLAEIVDLSGAVNLGNIGGAAAYALVMLSILLAIRKGARNAGE